MTIFGAGRVDARSAGAPRGGDGQACLVDVRDGTSTVLSAGPAARVCAVSGDGRRAVVRLGRRGARELELVDLRSGLRIPLLPGGGAVVADARFDRDRLYVHTDAGRDRPALLAVDLRGRSAVRVVAARDDADLDLVALDPEAAPTGLVDPDLETFAGEDGLPMSGWLPTNARPYPELSGWAWTCAASPTSTPSTRAPSRGSRWRSPPSTAT